MVKKAKGKHRLDKYYNLAKEQGYRSRAAFKLIQLNRKYHFLEGSRALLDLCAAPGGWLQVASKHMPMGSLIIGIDLVPIRAIRGCRSIVGDITTQKARDAIKKEAGGSLMDAVIHDGAPNVGGAWGSEAYSQSALVLESLRLACDVLAPRGTFVTKIFRSQDYTALLYAFKQLFGKVEATKPAASRNTSAEIFVVCLGFKAPSKIDPRLLDPKHLFKEIQEVPKIMGPDALLKQKIKQRRHREGYEEGLSSTYRPLPAAAFITSDKPVELLGLHSRFVLEGEGAAPAEDAEGGAELAAYVQAHPATSAEIRRLCQDLQVLGRGEFKALLKWRTAVKKAWDAQQAQDQAGHGDVAEEEAAVPPEEQAGAKEEQLLEEMSGVKDKMERRLKREKRRRKEQKTKARIRAAQMAQSEGINEADANAPLFSLSALKAPGSAAQLGESAAPAAEELEVLEGHSDEEALPAQLRDTDAGSDSDEERRQYELDMEDNMDALYQSYLERRGKRKERARAKRKRLGAEGELGSDEEGLDEERAPEYQPGSDAEADEQQAALSTHTQEAPSVLHRFEAALQAGNGLIVPLDERRIGRPTSSAAVAAQWFAQDLFAGADVEDKEPTAVGVPAVAATPGSQQRKAAAGEPAHKARKLQASAAAGSARVAADQQVASAIVRAAPGSKAAVAAKQQQAAATAEAEADSEDEGAADVLQQLPAEAEPAGFVEVPLAGAEDSDASSEDEFGNLDDNGKAEVLALAKKMLGGRIKNDILEQGYHRYAFHDDGVPSWFAADEARHMRAPVVLSKEEVDADRAALRAVDARPIKKVAEARLRKRKRLSTKLEAARSKAEAISGNEDMAAGSKAREIEKLYAKARASGKGKDKKGKPSRSAQYKNKGKPLDPRLRKDKRQVNFKAKAKAAKKKQKGKGKGPARKSK